MTDEPKAITALSDIGPDQKPKRAPRRRKDEDALEQEQLTDEEINDPTRRWYFVHTYSGHENKVRNAIMATVAKVDASDKIFHVIVPTEDEIEIRDGQRRTVKRKLYPGYVLVQTIPLDAMKDADTKASAREAGADENEAKKRQEALAVWQLIRNTTGVTGFVSSGTAPVPLSKEEVNHILRAMRMEQPRVRVAFQPGQSVRIVDGPFEDFVGTVDEINTEKGRVKVIVNMFGRETPVELDFLQVERV